MTPLAAALIVCVMHGSPLHPCGSPVVADGIAKTWSGQCDDAGNAYQQPYVLPIPTPGPVPIPEAVQPFARVPIFTVDEPTIEWLGNLMYVTTASPAEATGHVGKQAIAQKITLDIQVGLRSDRVVVWRRVEKP